MKYINIDSNQSIIQINYERNDFICRFYQNPTTST